MYTCYSETLISRIVTPDLQELFDVFRGRVKFMSKFIIDYNKVFTSEAVYNILKASKKLVKTGFMTFGGCITALHAPILGVRCHYVDEA